MDQLEKANQFFETMAYAHCGIDVDRLEADELRAGLKAVLGKVAAGQKMSWLNACKDAIENAREVKYGIAVNDDDDRIREIKDAIRAKGRAKNDTE